MRSLREHAWYWSIGLNVCAHGWRSEFFCPPRCLSSLPVDVMIRTIRLLTAVVSGQLGMSLAVVWYGVHVNVYSITRRLINSWTLSIDSFCSLYSYAFWR